MQETPNLKIARRFRKKLESRWKEDYPLELICLTKAELEEKKKNVWGVASHALRTGVVV